MSIGLALAIVFLSLAMTAFFVFRDAQRFALKPPTPLVDLDRMYDTIFEQLDDVTGSAITPAELSIVLDLFVSSLDAHGLVKEDLAPESGPTLVDTLTTDVVVADIQKRNPNLDVDDQVLTTVVDLAFAYLRDISAVT